MIIEDSCIEWFTNNTVLKRYSTAYPVHWLILTGGKFPPLGHFTGAPFSSLFANNSLALCLAILQIITRLLIKKVEIKFYTLIYI
jgi:hypothetical protein